MQQEDEGHDKDLPSEAKDHISDIRIEKGSNGVHEEGKDMAHDQ